MLDLTRLSLSLTSRVTPHQNRDDCQDLCRHPALENIPFLPLQDVKSLTIR